MNMLEAMTFAIVAGAFVYVSQIHSQLKKVLKEIKDIRDALESTSNQ